MSMLRIRAAGRDDEEATIRSRCEDATSCFFETTLVRESSGFVLAENTLLIQQHGDDQTLKHPRRHPFWLLLIRSWYLSWSCLSCHPRSYGCSRKFNYHAMVSDK